MYSLHEIFFSSFLDIYLKLYYMKHTPTKNTFFKDVFIMPRVIYIRGVLAFYLGFTLYHHLFL